MAFKMRGWSSHTRFNDTPRFPEKPKVYTEEEKKRFADKEKQSIQNKVDRKEKKIKKKIAKGSTWGLERKKRKVAKLKKSKEKADGSATIRMMKDQDFDKKYNRANQKKSSFTKKMKKKKDNNGVKSTISNKEAKGINVENISAVQNKNGKNFVVEVDKKEYYDPSAKNNIGGLDNKWDSNYNDTNNRRDTMLVNDSYRVGDLVDETDWETGKATKKKKKKA